MIIRRDAVYFRKCACCNTDIVDIRHGRNDGIGMQIESRFCQFLEGREVARCEVVVATCIDTEDENFSSFHAMCLTPLSNVLGQSFTYVKENCSS